MLKISGIYKISNKITNKIYIGQSLDINTRIKDHIRRLNNNKHDNRHLQYSWNKYGEKSFEFLIIETCEPDIEILNQKEIYWINTLGALNRAKGYNISSGGGNGFSLAGKTQEEISLIYKKITEGRLKKWAKDGNPRKGGTISEEQKEYLSKINLGANHPQYGTKKPEHSKRMAGANSPTAKKIICLTTGEVFECAKYAEQKYKTTNSNILKCCRGVQKFAGRLDDGTKLIWEYIR